MPSQRDVAEQREIGVVQEYIDWRKSQSGIRLAAVRPENGTWDFSLTNDDGDVIVAVEIKGLVESAFERGYWTSEQFCHRIENQLGEIVNAPFDVMQMPELDMPARDRNQITEATVEVATKLLPTIPIGETLDLGPRIAAACDVWPTDNPSGHYDPDGTYIVIYPPLPFVVHRGSGDETYFELGVHSGPVTNTRPMWIDALRQILSETESEDPRWVEQLNSARELGITETVLLLDDRVFIDPDIVVDVFQRLPIEWVSAVSSVYLIRPGAHSVTQISP